MNADPKHIPEERFEVLHEAMRLAKKRPDGHEDLGSCYSRGRNRLFSACHCEVQVC